MGSQPPSPLPDSTETGTPALADPYRAWLGIQTTERPPSHYALLGVPELEDNVHAINEAARKAKKTVRAYQIGKYRSQALAVLTEIGQAVDVLTHRDKKSAYDAHRLTVSLRKAEDLFPQTDMDRSLDQLFVEWLTACAGTGLPVVQILPDMMQWCLKRNFAWPRRGEEDLPLPMGLWLYRDVAIVARCVERGPFERRAEAVKQIQQAAGLPESLSRLVVMDVFRRPQSFALMPEVRLAAEQPRELLQQWVNRLAACDAAIPQRSDTFEAMAFVLGLAEEDGSPIAEPIRPQIIVAQKPSPLVLLWDDVRDRLDTVLDVAMTLPARYPQYLPTLRWVAILAGGIVLAIIVALVLAAAL
ncbi:MAG: hypothetical protein GXY74_13540 [Phycisphaerae bacterium]|nr:hypothetical protein [Phycisphaerae bacterium]